jgi:hypothetical protein
MATQRGLQAQIVAFDKLSGEYWKAKRNAEASLRRLDGMLHEPKISTGDLMLDYCLLTYGLHYKSMVERYKSVNKTLVGRTGELVLAEWNEKIKGDGFLRHFKLGILAQDEILFPYKLNCIMPVHGYVTHEDIGGDKVRPGGFHERSEFFVPAKAMMDDFFAHLGYTSAFREFMGPPYDREPSYHFASVVVGDEDVRKWFKWDRSGVPGYEATGRRLEERLRSYRPAEQNYPAETMLAGYSRDCD